MTSIVVIDGVEYVPKNSGRSNSGHYNSGHYNSGDSNSGHYNSGHYNSGHYNSGHFNSGDFNSGHYNSGDYNSGDFNSGHYNSGHYNSGHYNSGHFNSGDYNSGFFCTDTPPPAFFDRPTTLTWDEAAAMVSCVVLPVGCRWVPANSMTDEEQRMHPNHKVIGGYLKVLATDVKTAFRQAWDTTISAADKRRFLALPNFDAEKFARITGVDVRAANAIEAADTVIVGGKKYVAAS